MGPTVEANTEGGASKLESATKKRNWRKLQRLQLQQRGRQRRQDLRLHEKGRQRIRDMRRVLLSTEWDDMAGVMIQEDFAVTNVKVKEGMALGKVGPRRCQQQQQPARTIKSDHAVDITLWEPWDSCVLSKEQLGDPVSGM